MISHDNPITTSRSPRRWGAAAALVAAGLAGGVVLASTASANAATTAPTPSASSGTTGGTGSSTTTTPQHPSGDQSKAQRSDETLLTGTTADKVRAAALAKYPNATIQRVETNSDGVYEAHVVTSAGDWVIVEVGADFTVTGTQTPGQGGMGGDHGRPGNGTPGVDPDPNDNDGPGTGVAPSGAPAGTAPSATPSTTA